MADHAPKDVAFSALLDLPGAWACPRCGTGPEEGSTGGLVTDGHECAVDRCTVVLPDDECYCSATGTGSGNDMCGWCGTARQVANAAKKRLGLVPCAACHGTGFVKDGGAR